MDDQLSHGAPAPEPPEEPGDPHWDAVARELAGESTPASADRVRAWRQGHADDAAAVDALDATLDATLGATLGRTVDTPPADLDVEAALRAVKARRAEAAGDAPRVLPFEARARRAPARPAPTRRTFWSPMMRAAAAVLVVAGGVAGWRAMRGGAGEASVVGRTFATAVGARDSVRLPDGTRVVLGPGSTLDVASDYGAARREVRLRGSGYFVVHHDTTSPFVVRTAAATMQDVGTAFTVRDGTDGRVTVAVTDGAVLLHAAGQDGAPGVLVPARGRGTVIPGSAPTVTADVVTDEATAWTRGELSFDDAPFPEVAAELRRWYGLELRASDSALVARHLTAQFHGESPDEVLRVVGLALGAAVDRRGDTAIVRLTPR